MIARDKLPRDIVIVLASIAATIGIILGFLGLAGSLPRFGHETDYRVSAVMPTSAALAPGSRVTMAGAQVGRVKSVKRQGLGAVIAIDLTNADVIPLPKDSRLQLRSHTPVGENYVSITKGRSMSTLADGAVIPMTQADDYVDVDEVLSTLRGPARAQTRALLRSLGGTLDGRGHQLNATAASVGRFAVSFGTVIQTLHADRQQLSDLVEQTGALTAQASERGQAIRVLGASGLQSFRALASRDEQVAVLLTKLPATLKSVRRTTQTAGVVSDSVTPVLTNAAMALKDVRPAVSALRPAAQQARNLVGELGRSAGPLQKVMTSLRNAAGPAAATIPPLGQTLCQVNPMLRYMKPYAADFPEFFVNLGSAANAYDSLSHVLRLSSIVGENSLVGLPDAVSQASFKLTQAGLLGKITGGINYDPYPKPGSVGRQSSIGTRHISGPVDLKAHGFKYQRITPDCHPWHSANTKVRAASNTNEGPG